MQMVLRETVLYKNRKLLCNNTHFMHMLHMRMSVVENSKSFIIETCVTAVYINTQVDKAVHRWKMLVGTVVFQHT